MAQYYAVCGEHGRITGPKEALHELFTMLLEVLLGGAPIVLNTRTRLLVRVNIVVVLERGQAPGGATVMRFKEAAAKA